MYLKNRKGNKIIESYSEDIYNLSYFYIDSKFTDPLDDIFSVGVKPGVFIKNIIKLEGIEKQGKEISNSIMSDTDKVLQAILKSIDEVKGKVDHISDKQDTMQIQIDAHTVSINNWNEKFNETVAEAMILEEIQANVKKKKINEDEERKNGGSKGSLSNINHLLKAKENKIFSNLSNNKRREKTQKTVIVGVSESVKVKTAEKTFDVFVGNIHMEAEEGEVLNMFSSNNIRIIKYGELETRLKKAKAFRVRINYEDKDKIFNPKIWPKGVRLSKYFEKVEPGIHFNSDRKLAPSASSSPKAKARGDESI